LEAFQKAKFSPQVQ